MKKYNIFGVLELRKQIYERILVGSGTCLVIWNNMVENNYKLKKILGLIDMEMS